MTALRPQRLRRGRPGHAFAEIGLVSLACVMIVFGTVDFGRAVLKYSDLRDAVEQGARHGMTNPSATGEIKAIVIDGAAGLSITPGDITITCTGGCQPGSAGITVEATALFTPYTSKLLGLGTEDRPIRMHAEATLPAR